MVENAQARLYKNRVSMTNETPASAIEFEGLSKDYGSGTKALDSLTLSIPRGEIFGFLGPNGAGKTTTIRLMLDLIRPTAGKVSILGKSCNDGDPSVRESVGYLPGDLSLYPNMTGRAMVDLFASLRPGRVREEWVRSLCNRLSIDLEAKTRELSHGNKQKIGIVLALMAEADVIILDEPTNGLDPLAQREVLAALREVRDRGATVFFSSHNLPEVERICDRVAMIREGQLISVERVADVVSRRHSVLDVTFGESVPHGAFAGLDGVSVSSLGDDGTALRIEVEGEVDPLIKALASHHVVAVESMQPSLEEEFLALYQRDAAKEGA